MSECVHPPSSTSSLQHSAGDPGATVRPALPPFISARVGGGGGLAAPPPPLSESTPDHTRRSDGGGCESCTAGEFCATSSGRARCVPLDCANVLQHSCMLPSVPSCSAWESPPNETNAVDAPRQCTLTSCEDSATGAYCVESPRVDGLIHGWAPASIAASCIGGRFEFK